MRPVCRVRPRSCCWSQLGQLLNERSLAAQQLDKSRGASAHAELSFDDAFCPGTQPLRDRNRQGVRGPAVDDEEKLAWLLDRQARLREYHVQEGVGHYGGFNGSIYRSDIAPRMQAFMRRHAAAGARDKTAIVPAR